MLDHLGAEQVRRVAELARKARTARDRMLEHMKAEQLAEPPPAKGTHDVTAPFGFDPLPSDHADRVALRRAMDALPDTARAELVAVALVGTGDYARGNWADALAAAEGIGADRLMERANLDAELTKGLYELRLA